MSIAEAMKKVYHKLTWTWNPGSDKEAGDAIVKNLMLHWFPNKVSKKSLSWNYSFYLGTISFVLFMILVFTGVVLMFLYVPSVERAYGSVKDLEYVVSFGWLLRGLHRIGAHLMVAVVFLHMVRVFLTGAYKNGSAVGANRPLNWIIGVALLLLTLLLSFTGYLLPWDQLAFWAITVHSGRSQSGQTLQVQHRSSANGFGSSCSAAARSIRMRSFDFMSFTCSSFP
ncbi:MAG: cytochrome b/b6 domain protein [Bacteroidetes bacterium]|nr:cytochrome b/b6 domain protein [Bacteroidota bacterium]